MPAGDSKNGTYGSANIMILNKIPHPPQKNSAPQQHKKQMLPRACAGRWQGRATLWQGRLLSASGRV